MAHDPQMINLYVAKVLLAEIDQDYTKEDANLLYSSASNFVDQRAAILLLKNQQDSIGYNTLEKAMEDPFWDIRRLAISSSDNLAKYRRKETLDRFIQLAEKDEKSTVRATAIGALAKHYAEETEMAVFEKGLQDISYRVVAASLNAIHEKDQEQGIQQAERLETEENNSVILTIARIYSEEGDPKRQEFYESSAQKLTGFGKYPLYGAYANFIVQQDDDFVKSHLDFLMKESLSDSHWVIRSATVGGIIRLKDSYEAKKDNLTERISNEQDPEQKEGLRKQMQGKMEILEMLNASLKSIDEQETNSRIKGMLAPALMN